MTMLLGALVVLQVLTVAQLRLMQLDSRRRQEAALRELDVAEGALEQHRLTCPEAGTMSR